MVVYQARTTTGDTMKTKIIVASYAFTTLFLTLLAGVIA